MYKIYITPSSIILTNKKEQNNNIIIDKDNFDIFQSYIQNIFCLNNSELFGSNITYNPKGKKAEEIVEKIMNGRKKIAEENGNKNSSIIDRYLSILSVGLQIPINKLIDLTIYQLFDMVERFNLFNRYKINLKVKLAGGSSNEKIEDWTKSIH